MKIIELTHGQRAIVDDADYEWLAHYKWSAIRASRPSGRWYAVTKARDTFAYMHRLIMGEPVALTVDHANGDRLDNQRANLRLATRTEQARNKRKSQSAQLSRFKGVRLHYPGKWRAEIWVGDGRRIRQYASSENEAARIYNDLARAHFGDFAVTNDLGAS